MGLEKGISDIAADNAGSDASMDGKNGWTSGIRLSVRVLLS